MKTRKQIIVIKYPIGKTIRDYMGIVLSIVFAFSLNAEYKAGIVCIIISLPFFYLTARNKLLSIEVWNDGLGVNYLIQKKNEWYKFEGIEHFFVQKQFYISDPYLKIVFRDSSKKRISLPFNELMSLSETLRDMNLKIVTSRYKGEGAGF